MDYFGNIKYIAYDMLWREDMNFKLKTKFKKNTTRFNKRNLLTLCNITFFESVHVLIALYIICYY